MGNENCVVEDATSRKKKPGQWVSAQLSEILFSTQNYKIKQPKKKEEEKTYNK